MNENTKTNCTNDEINSESKTCEAVDNSLYCETMKEVGSNGIVRLLPRYSKILNAGTSSGAYSTPFHFYHIHLLSYSLTHSSDKTIDLVVCQHGERAITLVRENGLRSYIATHYMNNRLNSPNDLVWYYNFAHYHLFIHLFTNSLLYIRSSDGSLYFTDPTYGIKDKNGVIVNQQIPYNGVYMIQHKHVRESILSGTPTTFVKLLTSTMSMPNGLAFSPDYGKLYVSNSDSSDPYWNVYDVDDNGLLANETVFFNASTLAVAGHTGLPDGLKVDIHGNIFASGPGGVIIFSPKGDILGKLMINQPVSNVAFGKDGKLYVTAKDIVTRVRVKTKPADGSIK
jgi:gluconolactonase